MSSPKVGEIWDLCNYYGIVTVLTIDGFDERVTFKKHRDGHNDWAGLHWFSEDRGGDIRPPVNISSNLSQLLFLGEFNEITN